MTRNLITVSVRASQIAVDEGAIKKWSERPHEAPMQAALQQAEQVVKLARDFVGKDTHELQKSIRINLSSNQTGPNSWLVRAGGLGTTLNGSGNDYAVYHHGDNPFLTDAIEAVGVRNSNNYVYY